MTDLYALLEIYFAPVGVEGPALERCGRAVADWLDAETGGRITEHTQERVLLAAADCLAELSAVLYAAGAAEPEDLTPGGRSHLREVAERRLGRYGLMDR